MATSIDVLVDAANITVLGPPNRLDVQLDVGPRGQRGSQIYVGSGLPSSSTIANYSSVLPGDLYINTAPGVNYSYLYQLVVRPAGNEWIPVLQIQPAIYRALFEVEFVAGQAEISIPISNITTATTAFTINNFAVEFSFEHDNPVSASISSKSIVSNQLVLVFSAVEWDGSSWANLVADPIKMGLSINVVTGSTVV
jgi:hypothetical protein